MGFLAPYMLFGALAAGIPIALHFFFRSRYRTVPWAAMKFLLTSIEQTSRRLKLQELLLLMARVALLVLLALALARPLTSSAVGSGRGPVDAVFILDTSFSMGARQGTQDRLDLAKEAALRVLDQLPPYSTAQVVTCADRAILLGPRASANLDQVRDVIQKVELTHLATDFAPGVAEASAALKRGNAANKELYLFSDMQKLGWEAQARAQEKSGGVATGHRCPPRPRGQSDAAKRRRSWHRSAVRHSSSRRAGGLRRPGSEHGRGRG